MPGLLSVLLAALLVADESRIDWSMQPLFTREGRAEHRWVLGPASPALGGAESRGRGRSFRGFSFGNARLTLDVTLEEGEGGLFLEVRDSMDRLLARDTDGEGSLQCELEVALPADAPYVIRTGFVDQRDTGILVLQAAESPSFIQWVSASGSRGGGPASEGCNEAIAQARALLESTTPNGNSDLRTTRSAARLAIERLAQLDEEDDPESVAVVLLALEARANALGDRFLACQCAGRVVRLLARTRPPDDEASLTIAARLCQYFVELGDTERAIAIGGRGLLVAERSLPAGSRANRVLRLTLAETLLADHRPHEARQLLDLELFRAPSNDGTPPGAADCERLLASCMRVTGHPEDARELASAALQRLQQEPPCAPDFIALATRELAEAHAACGDLASALDIVGRTIDELRLLPTTPFSALSVLGTCQADLLLASGFIDWSEQTANDALQAARALQLPVSDRRWVAATSSLTAALFRGGDVARALSLLDQQRIELTAAVPAGHPLVLTALITLGYRCAGLGDRVSARHYFESAATASSLATDPSPHMARYIRQSLASLMADDGEIEAARATYRDLRASTASGDELAQLEILGAQLAIRDGDLAGTTQHLRRALAEYARFLPTDHSEMQNTRAGLIACLRQSRQLEEARRLEEEQVAALRSGADRHPMVVLATFETMVLAATAARNREMVEELLQYALPAWTEITRWARALAARPAAQLLAGRKDSAEAFVAAARVLPADAALVTDVFEALESARGALAESVRGHDDDSAIVELAQQEFDARASIAAVTPSVSGQSLPAARELRALVVERDRIEGALRAARRRKVATASSARLRAADLAVALKTRASAAAASYWRYKDPALNESRLAVFVLRADGSLSLIDCGRIEELETLASEWRAAVGRPVRPRGFGEVSGPGSDPTEIGRRLRAALVDPILAATPEAPAIYVAAHGFLHEIPLDALPLEAADGRVVGDRIDIRMVSSFERLVRTTTSGTGDTSGHALQVESASLPSALLVGGIDYGIARQQRRAFTPLKSSALEVSAIDSCFRDTFGIAPTTLTGPTATKHEFMQQAPKHRFLHIATHGWYVAPAAGPRMRSLEQLNERSETDFLAPLALCRIALAGANEEAGSSADGAPLSDRASLTAEELAACDLSACDLAVLATCLSHSGVRRDGVIVESLLTALHAAGARTVIASLWDVGDEPARELMTTFYELVWKRGESPATALWHAKEKLRAAGRPVSHWAGWVVSSTDE